MVERMIPTDAETRKRQSRTNLCLATIIGH
jgi:hypothetical protein